MTSYLEEITKTLDKSSIRIVTKKAILLISVPSFQAKKQVLVLVTSTFVTGIINKT